MNILYIVPSLKKKGPIEVLYNIVEDITEHDIHIIQLLKEPNTEDNSKRFSSKKNVSLVTLFENKSLLSIMYKIPSALVREVKKISPDIIHSHCLLPDFLTSVFLRKNIIITTCHNNPFEDYKLKMNNSFISYLMIKIQMYSFKRFNRVVAISSYIKTIIDESIENTSLVYNGISTSVFKQVDSKAKELIRIKNKLPKEKKIIISVSSLIKRKNVIQLVESFIEANEKEAILVIVGEGPEKKEIEFILKEKKTNNVFLMGHREDISDLMNISDLLVSISKSEGFSLIVAEANAIGLSMILSDIPPHKEQFSEKMIIDNKILFVNPNENIEDQLVLAIKEKINSKLSTNSNMLQEKFTSKFMSNAYLSIYKEYINS